MMTARRVRVSCASIQCAVVRGESIYCSKNIGRPWWTGKEAGERCGVIGRLTGEEFGGEGGVEGRRKRRTGGIYAVAKAHRQTG